MRSGWLFLAAFAAFAMPGRFTSLFYVAHEQSETQIGILLGTAPLISLLATPVLCSLADRKGLELVAALSYAAAVAFFLAQMVALPSFNILQGASRFHVLLVLRVLYGCFYSCVYPLTTAMSIAQLTKEHGEKGHERYGTQRLWGAVSWAVVSLGLGAVLDLRNVHFSIVYAGISIFGAIYIMTLWNFASDRQRITPASRGDELDDSEIGILSEDGETSVGDSDEITSEDSGSPILRASNEDQIEELPRSWFTVVVGILLEDGFASILFFNMAFWLAAGMSLVENLLFLFFRNDLHASNFLCGLSVVVTVVFEIPLFAKAPEMLARVGAPSLAVVGCMAFVLRGFGYAAAPNGWMVLFLEPLHGITYAASATATVAYVAERTPKGLEATGQSMLALIKALGVSGGTILGGYIMETFGSKVLYRGAGCIVFSAAVLFAIVNRFFAKTHAFDVKAEALKDHHSSASELGSRKV